MRSRSLLAIVVIGLLGMTAFGLITKFVFDSDKGLQKIARFKVSLLKEYSPRGIHEIALRRQKRKVTLRMVADPDRVRSAEHLHMEIADAYFKAFPRKTHVLQLDYYPPARWGCRASTPFLQKTIPIAIVRERALMRKGREKVAELIRSKKHLELVDVDVKKDRIRLRIGSTSSTIEMPKARALAKGVAVSVSRLFRLRQKGRVDIQMLDLSDTPAARIRKPAGPPSSASRAPKPKGGKVAHASSGPPSSKPPAGRVQHGKRPILGEWSFDYRGRPIHTENATERKAPPAR